MGPQSPEVQDGTAKYRSVGVGLRLRAGTVKGAKVRCGARSLGQTSASHTLPLPPPARVIAARCVSLPGFSS